MTFFQQAPVLRKKGEKEREGLFAYRPHELEYAICCCLGERDMVALKVMLFFTGNSNDGDFRIAQRTIFSRMNISEKPYYSHGVNDHDNTFIPSRAGRKSRPAFFVRKAKQRIKNRRKAG